MVTIAQPSYSLPTNPSVKWLATQERNLNRELPYPDTAAETTEEYVFRTYLQFLWLPQVRRHPLSSAIRFSRISCLTSAVIGCGGEVFNTCRPIRDLPETQCRGLAYARERDHDVQSRPLRAHQHT